MPADPVRPPFLSAADARERAAERALSMEQLALELLPWAQRYARPQISNFPVGAIVLGLSGALYAGANLEFLGESLSLSVHAEQAAVYNAWVHGEAGITLIASTAAPCGFCRQFLNELRNASELRIYVTGRAAATLAELLPAAFGPGDLCVGNRLMDGSSRRLVVLPPDDDDNPVTAAALAAASAAYAPYSGTYAGVGLRTADGTIVEGRYAENAAFNPSLSPMQGAMIMLALAGRFDAVIEEAALVEAAEPATSPPDQLGAGQRASATAILSSVAPLVRLHCVRAVLAGEGTATMEGRGGLDSKDTSALS
ncbi:MAG: cytidine deaminase [Candidatus Eremiobacteraeota bacterium]|nr:cytidine deaminase [Candidatus Eremiobacteraeota bacterium]